MIGTDSKGTLSLFGRTFLSLCILGGIHNMGQEKQVAAGKNAIAQAQIQQIQELASTIRYGTITLVFQDSILIQIEKNEKIRISKT